MPKSLIIFLFAFTFSLASFAQDEKVKVQFVSFPKLNNAAPVELLLGNEETMKIELPTNSLSPVYEVSRLSEWVIGKSSTGAEGEFTFDIYGKATSLSTPNQLILVLRKGASDADGLELIPLDIDQKGFAGGKYFFMNASVVDIAVEIGDQKLVLKPRNFKLVEPKPSKVDGSRKYLYVYLHFRKGEEAVPYYSSTWRFSEKARTMVFLYHDIHTKQLRTHSIRDYLLE